MSVSRRHKRKAMPLRCAGTLSRGISLSHTPLLKTSHRPQPNNDAAKHENLSVPSPPVGTDRKSQNPAPILAWDGVTVSNGGIAGNREIHGALPSGVGTPGIPLAYSTPSGQRLPCTECGGSERWQDGIVWRCVTCWPTEPPTSATHLAQRRHGCPFPPCLGDLVIPLSADGSQIANNGVPFPYLISAIEIGPDGQRYALFLESDTGWPLAQCRKAPEGHPVNTEEDA